MRRKKGNQPKQRKISGGDMATVAAVGGGLIEGRLLVEEESIAWKRRKKEFVREKEGDGRRFWCGMRREICLEENYGFDEFICVFLVSLRKCNWA